MTRRFGEQTAVRCVLMRGGTSKGLYFHGGDLPPPGPRRDALLLRLMGSPDVLQVDGLGGARPITSKVAIVSPSHRADADVDYTFAQVEIDRYLVVYSGNCGNISSGVGPFAVDEGLVEARDGTTTVRIHNTNTGRILVAAVPVRDGCAMVEGECAIPGVPGTGAEIAMNWAATVGGKTGRLLPTGEAVDRILLESGAMVEATLCDVGNPNAYIEAAAVGLTGSELSAEIEGDPALIETLREVRGKAAALLGFCDDWRRADELSPGLPLLGMVAPPAPYVTLSGTTVGAKDMDLRLRLMFMHKLHESVAGTSSICLAAASRVPGSVVARVTAGRVPDRLLIGHPSGVTPTHVAARLVPDAPGVVFDMLGFSRTARRLMDCNAYYPTSLLAGRPAQVGEPARERAQA